MSKLISDKITKTKLMVNTMKQNINLVANKGLDETFVSQWENECSELETCDKELDQLKEQLKLKKRELNVKIINLRIKTLSAKKIIKTNFDKEEWKTFGVADKR